MHQFKPGSGPPARTFIAWPASRRQRVRRVFAALRRLVGVLGLVLLIAVLVDMARRGVPLTWHGLRWWLSLWH